VTGGGRNARYLQLFAIDRTCWETLLSVCPLTGPDNWPCLRKGKRSFRAIWVSLILPSPYLSVLWSTIMRQGRYKDLTPVHPHFTRATRATHPTDLASAACGTHPWRRIAIAGKSTFVAESAPRMRSLSVAAISVCWWFSTSVLGRGAGWSSRRVSNTLASLQLFSASVCHSYRRSSREVKPLSGWSWASARYHPGSLFVWVRRRLVRGPGSCSWVRRVCTYLWLFPLIATTSVLCRAPVTFLCSSEVHCPTRGGRAASTALIGTGSQVPT